MWPENTATTNETKINTNIKGVAPIALSASLSPSANGGGKEGVRWVVENVVEGHPWDPLFWRNKFGDMEEVEYQGKEDAKIMKMYYIKSIHITLLINESNNTITAFRMGRVHE
jgi:hypothetical protein